MKQPLPMSQQQLTNLKSYYENNPEFAGGKGSNRRIQPLNGRNVGIGSFYGKYRNGKVTYFRNNKKKHKKKA